MEQQDPRYFPGTGEQTVYTPTPDEKTLGILAHILTLIAHFIAPLVIWLIKKDESPYVAAQAKESLNFQITMMICVFVSFLLMIVLIGFVLLWVIGILDLVLVIIATIKATEGKIYRYPINFRLIK